MITSADIAQHTAEFLAAGGEIEIIPFLFTKKAGHPDVADYIKRVYRGFYLEDIGSRSMYGRDSALPDYFIQRMINERFTTDAD